MHPKVTLGMLVTAEIDVNLKVLVLTCNHKKTTVFMDDKKGNCLT